MAFSRKASLNMRSTEAFTSPGECRCCTAAAHAVANRRRRAGASLMRAMTGHRRARKCWRAPRGNTERPSTAMPTISWLPGSTRCMPPSSRSSRPSRALWAHPSGRGTLWALASARPRGDGLEELSLEPTITQIFSTALQASERTAASPALLVAMADRWDSTAGTSTGSGGSTRLGGSRVLKTPLPTGGSPVPAQVAGSLAASPTMRSSMRATST
mmetsp:Transcript_26300/g.71153  ORF Transcript_26300/g.71153 Transcript_26300/m.71153 type:complete len:215 (+) Transcript_26300:165-809(+)